MDFFRKMKNKNQLYFLAAAVVFGSALLILGRVAGEPEDYLREYFYAATDISPHMEATAPGNFEYEIAIETRLEQFFSLVENAGKVRVMVSPLGDRETVFAVDMNQSRAHTREQDAQGGTRETQQYQSAETTVILRDRQGTDTPLILRQTEPRIEGIVIIAEGGDCPFVRDALTRAARAVLGLDAHLIQVLTMHME